MEQTRWQVILFRPGYFKRLSDFWEVLFFFFFLTVQDVQRRPGDRWMIRGPCEYVPSVEVEVSARRKAIPLDENEGIYVRDVKSGRVSNDACWPWLLWLHWLLGVSQLSCNKFERFGRVAFLLFDKPLARNIFEDVLSWSAVWPIGIDLVTMAINRWYDLPFPSGACCVWWDVHVDAGRGAVEQGAATRSRDSHLVPPWPARRSQRPQRQYVLFQTSMHAHEKSGLKIQECSTWTTDFQNKKWIFFLPITIPNLHAHTCWESGLKNTGVFQPERQIFKILYIFPHCNLQCTWLCNKIAAWRWEHLAWLFKMCFLRCSIVWKGTVNQGMTRILVWLAWNWLCFCRGRREAWQDQGGDIPRSSQCRRSDLRLQGEESAVSERALVTQQVSVRERASCAIIGSPFSLCSSDVELHDCLAGGNDSQFFSFCRG